jgi:hypothetical protein
MKRLILASAFLAATTFSIAGCSMMKNGYANNTQPSAATMEQCRYHSGMVGSTSMRRNDMTARRDIECATMMPN